MWQANWMSLGIIVTLLACMAQRLASSMRPTTYASAAFCRHIMVLPWKHKSYLPTSRAISWTNHKKGSFLMRSSVLFWNHQISQRATGPDWYFLVFLTFPAWRNSFWGALPPTVCWGFLWLAPPYPKQIAQPLQPSGPTLGLAMMMGIFPHPPTSLLPPPASLSPPSASSPPLSWARASWLGMGDELEEGASILSLLEPSSLLWSGEPTSPHLFPPF